MNKIGDKIFENFIPPFNKNDSGWNGSKQFIKDIVREIRPSTIIEVGTWRGLSAINMCFVIREEKLNCKIYCVDTWLGSLDFWYNPISFDQYDLALKNGYPQVYYQFLSNIVYHGFQDLIIPVPVVSTIGAKLLNKINVEAELIYIDGSHETEDVYNDIKAYWPLLKQGGVMFGDDFGGLESVRKAVYQYSGDTQTVFWSSDDGFWYMKK